MALILKKFRNMKVAFTFSGSLLKQLKLYEDRIKDEAMIISEKLAMNKSLTSKEVINLTKIPGGFFDISKKRMEISLRYLQLFSKSKKVFKNVLVFLRVNLTYIAESSWADEDLGLSIWIGKKQENTAWMWLAIARDALFKLTNSNTIYEAYKRNLM